ncbi:proteoglycan 4-like [Papaver somniferum]|uniref:proteoglycan 4-like n=1 Tax=Papaver somniferum TaxID=3469 RepID=UPI000E6FA50A|nr:proteoglycan 4-like [Papaver somniferum]
MDEEQPHPTPNAWSSTFTNPKETYKRRNPMPDPLSRSPTPTLPKVATNDLPATSSNSHRNAEDLFNKKPSSVSSTQSSSYLSTTSSFHNQELKEKEIEKAIPAPCIIKIESPTHLKNQTQKFSTFQKQQNNKHRSNSEPIKKIIQESQLPNPDLGAGSSKNQHQTPVQNDHAGTSRPGKEKMTLLNNAKFGYGVDPVPKNRPPKGCTTDSNISKAARSVHASEKTTEEKDKNNDPHQVPKNATTDEAPSVSRNEGMNNNFHIRTLFGDPTIIPLSAAVIPDAGRAKIFQPQQLRSIMPGTSIHAPTTTNEPADQNTQVNIVVTSKDGEPHVTVTHNQFLPPPPAPSPTSASTPTPTPSTPLHTYKRKEKHPRKSLPQHLNIPPTLEFAASPPTPKIWKFASVAALTKPKPNRKLQYEVPTIRTRKPISTRFLHPDNSVRSYKPNQNTPTNQSSSNQNQSPKTKPAWHLSVDNEIEAEASAAAKEKRDVGSSQHLQSS